MINYTGKKMRNKLAFEYISFDKLVFFYQYDSLLCFCLFEILRNYTIKIIYYLRV